MISTEGLCAYFVEDVSEHHSRRLFQKIEVKLRPRSKAGIVHNTAAENMLDHARSKAQNLQALAPE